MASETRFAEVRTLLERNGWSLARISGSHHIFEKAGSKLLSIPVHRGKVKPAYVRQVEKTIKEA
jgi:predicted RNA binding protein YcfA (HicA-like mRNA interferase family)